MPLSSIYDSFFLRFRLLLCTGVNSDGKVRWERKNSTKERRFDIILMHLKLMSRAFLQNMQGSDTDHPRPAYNVTPTLPLFRSPSPRCSCKSPRPRNGLRVSPSGHRDNIPKARALVRLVHSLRPGLWFDSSESYDYVYRYLTSPGPGRQRRQPNLIVPTRDSVTRIPSHVQVDSPAEDSEDSCGRGRGPVTALAPWHGPAR